MTDLLKDMIPMAVAFAVLAFAVCVLGRRETR